jgi:hypothetical protein
MRRLLRTLFLFGFVLAAAATLCVAQNIELGIDRSKLGSQPENVQEKTVLDIKNLHATWFRDGPTSGSTKGVSNFVNEVKLVKQQNLKILINIVQMDEDYDGELQKNHCGWYDKKLSQINRTKYAQRLRTLFGALKDAHLTLDAAEFGNEDDTACYDGDVPDGHVASSEEFETWLHGYGEFLKAGAEVLHEFFPEAKIITFGIAHGSDQWDKAPRHISKPGQLVARLRNVNGVNYLDNSSYHVDGYGTHIYAQSDIPEVINERLSEDAHLLGTDKPFWVTEFGFADEKAFKRPEAMNQALQVTIKTYDKLSRQYLLGPIMFYRYDVWLTDDSGQMLPLANVLGSYFARR